MSTKHNGIVGVPILGNATSCRIETPGGKVTVKDGCSIEIKDGSIAIK